MQDLLIRYFSGETTEDEKRILFSEIGKDPELKNEFVRIQNIKGLICFSSGNTHDEWASEKLTQFYSAIRRRKRRLYFLQFAKYASVVLVVVSCTLFSVRYFNNRDERTYNEIEAPVGQRVYITLNDGSTVWLNSRSKIRIPQSFDTKSRKVYLDGEAFFNVEKNKNNPFIVETSRYNVRVLGTKFNVLNYSEMTMFETTLIEGSVEISKADRKETIVLAPNEHVSLKDNDLKKSKVNGNNYSSWKEGVLIFDEEPFSEIIKKLELYYEVKFIIQNTKALDVVYTGKFNAKDSAERIIEIIHQTNKFTYRISPDNKIIYIR
jgi:ferric-dicitrate binding protein FerR (iron transport regulator)